MYIIYLIHISSISPYLSPILDLLRWFTPRAGLSRSIFESKRIESRNITYCVKSTAKTICLKMDRQGHSALHWHRPQFSEAWRPWRNMYNTNDVM
jgi:hypothetical protein